MEWGLIVTDFKEPEESISSLVRDIEEEKKTNSNLKIIPLERFQSDGKNLLLINVKALVDKEDEVHISVNQGEQTTVFEITVHKSDLGMVIGKNGETAKALRRILFGFASKHQKRAIMEIVE